MKKKETKQIQKQFIQFLILISIPTILMTVLYILEKGTDYTTLYKTAIYMGFLPGGFALAYFSFGIIRQAIVLSPLNQRMSRIAEKWNWSFKPYPKSLLNNPGKSGTVTGSLSGHDTSLTCFFHGFQLGRSSCVVRVEGVVVEEKFFFAHKKHKLPRIDFWNKPVIPSLSFFLCEGGPLVKIKGARRLVFDGDFRDFVLFTEDAALMEDAGLKQALSGLLSLRGALYTDGKNLYYAQYKHPKNSGEIQGILDALKPIVNALETSRGHTHVN